MARKGQRSKATGSDLKERLTQYYTLKETPLYKSKSTATVTVHVIIIVFVYLNLNHL